MNIIIVLNLISILLAVVATYVGVTDQDTWSKEKGRPTKTGVFVIVLACLTAVIQVSIQTIQWNEKKEFDADIERIYGGWISVGVYDKNSSRWDRVFLKGLQDRTPGDVKNHIYVTQGKLNIRTPPPNYCPDDDNNWFGESAKTGTILPEDKYVKIVDSRLYDNCNESGKIRVVAKIVLVSGP